MKKTKDQGFTLVELLIVIVILGVLATVVVFSVSGITDSGRKSACETEARSYATAIEAFYAQEGEWPTSAQATRPAGNNTETPYVSDFFSASSAPQYFRISSGGGSATAVPVLAAIDGQTACEVPVFS